MTRILEWPTSLQMSQISKNDSRKDAKLAKEILCGLGVFARKNEFFSCFVSLRLGLASTVMHQFAFSIGDAQGCSS